MATQRAFVAGATGYTGLGLLRALGDRGIPTTAHVRPDSSRLSAMHERFKADGHAVSEASWTPETMAEALRASNPTLVFGVLGTTRARAKTLRRSGLSAAEETYDAVDFGLTALLIDACVTAKIRPRFVYLSSLGASATSRSAYMRARGRAEAHLLRSGLDFTIVRASFISGPDREEHRTGERIGSVGIDAALGLVGLLGGKRTRRRYRARSGYRLADGLVAAALAPSALGATLTPDRLDDLTG